MAKDSDDKFQVGDSVVLKSGGPVMTVDDLHESNPYNNNIGCVWFAGKKREHADFSPQSLRRATDADK